MTKRKRVRVDDLYPPQEVTERRLLLDRFWRGEDIGRPLVVARSGGTPYHRTEDPDTAAKLFSKALEVESRSPWDALPCYATTSWPIALATAFGGRVMPSPDANPWIEPVVHVPEDVYKVILPDPLAGEVGKAVARYRHTLERLEGYVPPRVPDMQGPLMVAAMLWKQEDFLLAMHDHPKEVHHLVGVATDHIISVYRWFRDTWPDAYMVGYPSCYMPREFGVGMTEDFMHLLSPDLYREFGLPYVNRISREFGGIFFHCCGVFKQHWPTVKQFHNLRGMDTQYPYSRPEDLFEAFPDVVHSMTLDYAERRRNFSGGDPDAFLKFLLARTPRNLRWMLYGDADDLPGLRRKMALVLEARAQ